jgi:ribosome-binding protein aMBF1 (putative translation factor)
MSRKLTLQAACFTVKPLTGVETIDVQWPQPVSRICGMDRFEDQVKRAFAKRLRQARLDAGYKTATSFANALKVQSARYRYWERGAAMPDLGTMTRICLLLDVEPNELLPLAVKKKHPQPGTKPHPRRELEPAA